MKFEWDGTKSELNREKHGIDFEMAEALWLDKNKIEIEAPHPIEKRNIIIAELHGKLWTAIFTIRSNAVRIISVRRSREKEVELYGKEKTG
ncbi:MAG: BrnT family toxin [Nitrospirae bacterium]|nr:BrnT family toxin [Nitrospirota bacterium]